MNFADIRKYLSPHLMAMCAYLHLFFAIWTKFESLKIYALPGADETSEAYSMTFLSLHESILYLSIIFLLFLLTIIEIFADKKYNKNVLKSLNSSYLFRYVFWTGMVLVFLPFYFFLDLILNHVFYILPEVVCNFISSLCVTFIWRFLSKTNSKLSEVFNVLIFLVVFSALVYLY